VLHSETHFLQGVFPPGTAFTYEMERAILKSLCISNNVLELQHWYSAAAVLTFPFQKLSTKCFLAHSSLMNIRYISAQESATRIATIYKWVSTADYLNWALHSFAIWQYITR
jgi:hypothetical protein